MKRGDLIKIVFEDDCNPMIGIIIDIANKFIEPKKERDNVYLALFV